MVNSRDTFYVTLRDRLAQIDPQRTAWIRGTQRTAIEVEDAEPVLAQPLAEVFVLRWTGLKTDARGPLALAAMDCEIRYGTAGAHTGSGLDRGRRLAAMDAELRAMLAPPSAVKMDYTQAPPVAMGTRVFWSDPVWGAVTVDADRLERKVVVTVFGYEEEGEQ